MELHGIVSKLPTSAQVSNEVLAGMKNKFANFEERPRLRVVAVELDHGVTGEHRPFELTHTRKALPERRRRRLAAPDVDIADGDTCVEPSCYMGEVVLHTN